MSTNTTAINNNNDLIRENVASKINENDINSNENNNIDNRNNNVDTRNNNNAPNNNEENELYNNENIWLIIKGLLSLLFNNKFIIYGNYELADNRLKINILPLVQLPAEDAYKILYSFTDIAFNNSIFMFLTLLFISDNENKINRTELITYIKLTKKYRYCLALIISIIKSCSIISVFIFSIIYVYPRYLCTKSLLKDKDDNLFWVNDGKKYKVDKIYDTLYFL